MTTNKFKKIWVAVKDCLPKQHFAMVLAVAFISCTSLCMNAQVANDDTCHQSCCSTVESFKNRLPIETPATGTIVSITAPTTPLTVTTNMGYIPEQNMQAFAQAPELFKNAIMENFSAMGDTLVILARAAYNAGIPFAVHITATTYPEGFTITFSIEDLEKGLKHNNK